MTTGERMKARRKEIGLSAEQVAEYLGVSPTTIYRYEKGDIEKVPGEILPKLAAALKTTPAFLVPHHIFLLRGRFHCLAAWPLACRCMPRKT